METKTRNNNEKESQITDQKHNEDKSLFAEMGRFVATPLNILKELGAQSAVIYGVIVGYCQMYGGKCTASQQTIANNAGCSRKTAIKHLKRLEDEGYIRSNKIPGSGIEYTTTKKLTEIRMRNSIESKLAKPVKKLHTSNDTCEKTSQPDVKNIPTNRTDNNRNNNTCNNKYNREKDNNIVVDDRTPQTTKNNPNRNINGSKTNSGLDDINDQKYQLSPLGEKILGIYRGEVNPSETITPEFCEMVQEWEDRGITGADFRLGLENWRKFGDSNTLRDPTSLKTWTEKAHARRIKEDRMEEKFNDPQILEFKKIWDRETGKSIKYPNRFVKIVRDFQEAEVTPEIFQQAIQEQQDSKYPVIHPKSVKQWAIGLIKEQKSREITMSYTNLDGEEEEVVIGHRKDPKNKTWKYRDLNTGEWKEVGLA